MKIDGYKVISEALKGVKTTPYSISWIAKDDYEPSKVYIATIDIKKNIFSIIAPNNKAFQYEGRTTRRVEFDLNNLKSGSFTGYTIELFSKNNKSIEIRFVPNKNTSKKIVEFIKKHKLNISIDFDFRYNQ